MRTSTLRRRLRGFTLLELVLVLSILVLLAGGLITQLDALQLRANKGVAASDMAGISRMIQTYKVTNNHYPDHFDSLIDINGGTPQLWGDGLAVDDPAPSLDPSLIDRVPGRPKKIFLDTPLAGEVGSLSRMGVTSLQYVDTDVAVPSGFPSDAFVENDPATDDVVVRSFDTAALTDTPVAILNSTLNVNDEQSTTVPPGDGDADAIMRQLYPQTDGDPPADKRVFVFGLGPECDLVGRSGMIQEAPLYANSADRTKYYARDLVLFEVDGGNSRARFLGALGADGDRLDGEVEAFYEIQ